MTCSISAAGDHLCKCIRCLRNDGADECKADVVSVTCFTKNNNNNIVRMRFYDYIRHIWATSEYLFTSTPDINLK